jgi:triose/dihydroxyacetone kinase / FAD-AMP lyase (cyclizing)
MSPHFNLSSQFSSFHFTPHDERILIYTPLTVPHQNAMVKPKKILNDAAQSVDEFIEGILLQYPTRLVKLENHHVILTSNRNVNHVQLISGGGSGHEPSHAGWLGSGMLSAAVCGGIFASPSVTSILAAIRAVADTSNDKNVTAARGGGGVLLIVKNYTGDRLNFGMAAEKAGQEGIHVQMIVTADDCALPRTKGITGARGVAGTVLVHKVAGAAAAAGMSLDEVAAIARRLANRMGTLGIALDSVTVPGAQQKNDRLDDETIEIGLGIHGEAGMKQSRLLTADEMAREMITKIQAHGREEGQDSIIVPLFQSGDQVVVLVNNLGGTSNFEMSILTRSCVKLLESDEFGVKAIRVLVGSFMTSFDMHGASLTIVNVQNQPDILALLDAPTTAPAWSGGCYDIWQTPSEPRPSTIPVPEKVVDDTVAEVKRPQLKIAVFDTLAKTMLQSAAEKLSDAEALLTKYDTVVGDGDCGMTMKRGAMEVLKRLDSGTIPVDHPVTMFAALADAVSASMGGTSGVLLELMFRKMSSTLSFCDTIGVSEMCLAVQAGVDAVSLYGGAQVGSRTMLDALVPAAASIISTTSLVEAAEKAKAGAESTATMKTASAGRSNYLSEESLSGTPDPGAIAVSVVFEAVSSVL